MLSKKKQRLLVMASLLALGGMGSAFAGTATASVPSADTAYSGMVKHLSHGKMQLLKVVPTPVKGLSGLVTKAATGQKTLSFGLDDRYLILGPIIDVDGKPLNQTVAEQAGLVPKPYSAPVIAEKAMSAPGFVLGHAGPMIAVFMDPNCIFCHLFYESQLSNLKAGKLRMKVIPVGFLKKSSMGKAVAIMTSKQPAKAWAEDESRFNVAKEEGGIVPAKNLKVPTTQEIMANNHLLAHTGEMATPTVVACLKGKDTPMVWHGVTPEAKKALSGDLVDILPTGKCSG